LGARIGSRPLRRILLGLWHAALPGLALPPAAAVAQTAVEGEFGLRVTDVDGEIGVGWLTPSRGRAVSW